MSEREVSKNTRQITESRQDELAEALERLDEIRSGVRCGRCHALTVNGCYSNCPVGGWIRA